MGERPILALTLARVILADPSSAQSTERQHSWVSFLEDKAAPGKDGPGYILLLSQLIVGFARPSLRTDFKIAKSFLFSKNLYLLNKNLFNKNSFSKEQKKS